MSTKRDSAPHILIVEDEPKLASLLSVYLGKAGYGTSHIADGNEAVEAVRTIEPDLILLDLMLPGRDGIDICREIRTFSHVPIIMVTARVEEIDRILGLQVGADDYVCKPFSPREVVARAQALLRRASEWKKDTAALDGLIIDDKQHLAMYRGRKFELTPVEFRLLKTLYDNPGRVFSRDQLMDKLYHDYRVVTDRTVDSHIKNLRRKLDQLSPDHEMIRSIYGVGYKFDVDA